MRLFGFILSLTLIAVLSAVRIVRRDEFDDVVVYINGRALSSGGSVITLPVYQQVYGFVIPNGQRFPPTVDVVSGTLSVRESVQPNMFVQVRRRPLSQSSPTGPFWRPILGWAASVRPWKVANSSWLWS